MHEHVDSDTMPTTGRGYNRHATDPEHAAVGIATDLYSPYPGGETDHDSDATAYAGSQSDLIGREHEAFATTQQHWNSSRQRPVSSFQTYRRQSTNASGGIMQK